MVLQKFCNFAAYSVMNERPKVLKKREFTKFKIMNKIIIINTNDRDIAILLQDRLGDFLDDHVNCVWADGSWVVEANASDADAQEIKQMIDQCENYAEGRYGYTIEDE